MTLKFLIRVIVKAIQIQRAGRLINKMICQGCLAIWGQRLQNLECDCRRDYKFLY